jgi:methylmalonyl-CoA mutase
MIAERIDRVRGRREDDVASRRAPLVGVSEFAPGGEAAVLRPAAPAPAAGPLPLRRWAAPFETLRDRADSAAAAGIPPAVLLVALGKGSQRRVSFATGLFRAGGIEPVVVDGPAGEVDGPAVACLCGSDEEYRRSGAAAALAMKRAGARWVWLAGNAQVEGVDGTIDEDGDALAVLARTLDLLEVP